MTKKKKRMHRPKEVFTLPAYILSVDEEQGIVEALVTTFGTLVESHQSVIHKGSFTKTLSENFGRIRVLDNHNAHSVLCVVGKPLEMRELTRDKLPSEFLAKYPEADGALYTKTQYLMDTKEGQGVFQRIDAGAIDEYSIGFDALKEEWGEYELADGETQRARHIREIRLWEYSPVIWGANVTRTIDAYGEQPPVEQHDFDLRKRASDVADAWHEQGRYVDWDIWVWRVYDTHIVLRAEKHPTLTYPFYEVGYTFDEETGEVTFADEDAWTGGNYVFAPGQMADEGPVEEIEASPPEQQSQEAIEAEPDTAPLTSNREAKVTALQRRGDLLDRYIAMC